MSGSFLRFGADLLLVRNEGAGGNEVLCARPAILASMPWSVTSSSSGVPTFNGVDVLELFLVISGD